MAKVLTPINVAANDTPTMLIALANNLVSTLATEIVTANTSPDGALTTGNGYVSGIFGASVLVGGELRGGAVNASANLVLSSNLTAVNNSITIKVGTTTVNSNFINVESATINSASINYFALNELTIGNTQISAMTFQANASANQAFDSFSAAAFRSAEYLLSIQDTSPAGNAYQLMKLLVVQDGSSAFITEYGIVTSNGSVGTVNAIMTGANVYLTVTPVVATNLELQATRIVMGT